MYRSGAITLCKSDRTIPEICLSPSSLRCRLSVWNNLASSGMVSIMIMLSVFDSSSTSKLLKWLILLFTRCLSLRGGTGGTLTQEYFGNVTETLYITNMLLQLTNK